MAVLTTKNFSTLVTQWAAVCQASVASIKPNLVLSFTIGSVLRALAEAQAAASLWLQGLILQLLTVTRLSTSQGTDCDTWVADFGLTRLPARAATGLVTFSRVTPTNPATVPVGATVQTADGSLNFTVTSDPTNGAFSQSLNGYVIPAQISSLQFPVKAVTAGVVGNVQANSITILTTGISGVDTVTNVAAFQDGFDAESDTALRKRFVLFINSLAKATDTAIGFAITSVQQGLEYQIFDNFDPDGITPDNGMVTVYVDDGSGNIDQNLLTSVTVAAQAVRAAGVRMGVFAATILPVNVSLVIVTALGYDHPTVEAQVVAALDLYINGLGLGNTLSYFKLAQVAFEASPGVTDVLDLTVNNFNVDIVPGPGQTIKVNQMIIQ